MVLIRKTERLVIGRGDGSIITWGIRERKIVKCDQIHESCVTCIALAEGGQFVVSSGYDQKVVVFDPETGKQTMTLTGHNHWVSSIDVSADSSKLITASR